MTRPATAFATLAALLTALLAGCGAAATSRPSGPDGAKKAEMREQRKAYDAWAAEDKNVRLAEKKLRIAKAQGGADEAAQAEQEVKVATQRRQEAEDKIKQKWGKSPKEFADLPPLDAKVYAE